MPAAIDRTTIVLPPRLKDLATDRARQQGVSFAEFVRQALERHLAEPIARTGDPFWDNLAVYDVPGPNDIAANHDDQLY